MKRIEAGDGKLRAKSATAEPEMTSAEAAAYTRDVLRGARRVLRGSKQFAFLDYLLAMGEQEAANLAANVYH